MRLAWRICSPSPKPSILSSSVPGRFRPRTCRSRSRPVVFSPSQPGRRSICRRSRAAVLPTGSELRRPGEPLAAGEIYEANGLILSAQLEAAGAAVELMPAVGDDEAAHRGALEHALDADVVVTSGGVSVGPHDLVRRVEAELGVEEVFWRVSVKPGKPIAFGVRERTLVFGLPGNPVSALVGFLLFVEPAIRALEGVPEPLPRFDHGRLAGARRRNPERDELVRARLRRSAEGPL